ncbi:hypothetical protein FACS1894152_2250 [Bacilli bacterium]|nr:hypothetical protein FACS1894152_2250 [Bacilli bacterium]
MVIEMAVIAVVLGVGSAIVVDQTIKQGVDATAEITKKEFEESENDSRKRNSKSLAGPKKTKNKTSLSL